MKGVLARARTDLIVLVVLTAALLPVPLFATGPMRTLAVRVLLAAMLGLAWNIMGGYAGYFSFGHAAFFGIGAYTGAVLLVKFGISPWIGMLVGAVLAGLFGAVTGWLSFRYELRGAYFALASFAFAEMLRLVSQHQAFLNQARGFRVPVVTGASWWMMQFPSRSPNYYFLVLGLLALTLVTVILFVRSPMGLFVVSIREDEDAAEAAGVDTMRYKVLASALSGAVTAVAGVFYLQFFFFIDPELAFGPAQSIAILLPAIVGGTGTIWGPVVGAAILIPLGDLSTRFVRSPPAFLDFIQGRSGIDLIIFGALLVLIILFLPKGVYGSIRERIRA